jgi:hypothetical protein
MTKRILFIIVLLVLYVIIIAENSSYIQVVAEPDISVFINDQFQGKTKTDIDGLTIEIKKEGNYNIKVTKKGYLPQEEVIFIKQGEVLLYNVKPFTPNYKISEKGNEEKQDIELKTGDLKIQSLPVSISINIRELGLDVIKTKDEWKIEDIPIGEYLIKFTWKSKTLQDTISIELNSLKHIFVNFIQNKIIIYNSKIQDNILIDKGNTFHPISKDSEGNNIINILQNKNDNIEPQGYNIRFDETFFIIYHLKCDKKPLINYPDYSAFSGIDGSHSTSTSSSVTIKNGEMKTLNNYEIKYHLRPNSRGQYNLPILTYKCNNVFISTKKIILNVQ